VRIYEDLRVVQARIGVAEHVILGLFGLLLTYFWHLQVLEGKTYQALADTNRTRVVSLAAPRGPLLDRNGKVLVENRPSLNIILNPDHVEDLDRTVSRLARVLKMGEAPIREKIYAQKRVRFEPVVVKADASLEDVAEVEAHRLELPEVEIAVVPLRSYPLAAAAAHTLGRVGEITEAQLRSPEFAGIEPGTLVGQAGLESKYNRELMGRDGERRVIVNSRGLEVAEKSREPPADGPPVTLTLDADLQRAMDEALRGHSGSAVAMDPETGEILAMSSTPAYDPNDFTTGVDATVWRELAANTANPFMNRVVQATYSPGSMFKVVMSIAALEEGVITPATTFYCPGYLSIYNTVFRCNRAAGHGEVRLREALGESCNVFFYHVGVKLEIERIARYAKKLGLGAPTGVDLPHEVGGLIPSPEWKLQTQRTPWFAGETVSVAIGQGQVNVTPLQMARVAALIANGGKLVHPHLVKAISGQAVPVLPPEDVGLKPETLEAVREGMRMVVSDQGTGYRAQIPGINVCGKTGSAQVVAHAKLVKGVPSQTIIPHGWFLCFAPMEHPRIALVTMVENGGSGAEAAAPVAHDILAHFFHIPAAGEKMAAAGTP
jgi:penicillin-binding protein 2